MRACLDTNVLISGIFWKGVPGRVLDSWVGGEFDVVASNAVMTEYQRVLREMGTKIDQTLVDEWSRTLVEKSILIISIVPRKRWSRDIHDDKFVQCALSGRVGYLVTGDKDLLDLDEIFPFEIVKPKEFLNCL